MKVKAKFTIGNELGLHFRAAAMVVRTLSGYVAQVSISNGKTVADARSVLDLITLAAGPGTSVTVEAEGKDAQEAIDALGSLINRNFAE